MITPSHQIDWADCKRRELWYRIVLYGFVPLVFIASVVASRLVGSDAPFMIMASVAMLAAIVVTYRLVVFQCPRCHRSFFSRSWWTFQPHKQKCVHCGFPKWSETDESHAA
jgi:predicted RNA-binding Zn-ribbon protein involved in translation (DUF1610 family)